MRTRFGEFIFDSDARLIERGPETVHLTGKAFLLFEILLEERPRAISKQELLDRVWPDVVVAAENVKNLVAEIRAALGEEWIRTAHHFGYAFAGQACDDERPEPRAWIYYEGRAVPLTATETYMGRDRSCAICIDVPGVSRRHARITISDGAASLEDLGSKNGTHIGDVRVTDAVRLQDGDRIQLGSVQLTFRAHSSADVTTTDPAPKM